MSTAREFAPDRPALLNLGCGQTFHADWVNVDVAPAAPEILRWDLNRGLPFADCSFDACYCSHVLEHLTPAAAARAVKEMFRVLRPRGIARVVVPDLRGIAERYLALSKALDEGDLRREADYDWMMLELLDQAVRDTSGGEMARFLRRADLPNRDFIRSRIGEEADRFWRGSSAPESARGWSRVFGKAWSRLGQRALFAYALARIVGGSRVADAFRVGLYRQQGEIHQWMYDSFSLSRLLRRAGFIDVSAVTATRSAIAGFAGYRLDADEHGNVRKPDSLFIEGLRPDSEQDRR